MPMLPSPFHDYRTRLSHAIPMSVVQRMATNPRMVVVVGVAFVACAWLVFSSFEAVALGLPVR